MKILVVQTAFIGDAIMATPIFRALHELYPDAKIHALTIPQSAIVFKYNPFVEKIIKFDKKSGIFKKIISIFRLIHLLRREKYDIAISVQHSLTSALLMLLAGIERRIGNARQKYLTDRVQIPKGLHIRQRVLALLTPLSQSTFSDETEVFLSTVENQKAEEIIAKFSNEDNTVNKKNKIAIAPGSVWATKRWLPEYFSDLIKLLDEKNIDIYVIGSPQEKEFCQKIIDNSGAERVVNLAGELNLLESAALIKKMDLLLSNDSSPLHLANGVGTDVFAFFGPTVKRFGCYPYRPNDKMLEVDLDCRPCSKHGTETCPLGHHNCMKLISPERVAELIFQKFNLK